MLSVSVVTRDLLGGGGRETEKGKVKLQSKMKVKHGFKIMITNSI